MTSLTHLHPSREVACWHPAGKAWAMQGVVEGRGPV